MTIKKYRNYEIIGPGKDDEHFIVRLSDGTEAEGRIGPNGKLDGRSIGCKSGKNIEKARAKAFTPEAIANRSKMADPSILERQTLIMDELRRYGRVDLFDADDVETRLRKFLELSINYGLKPTVAGFALSLGLHRQRIHEIVHGRSGEHGINCSEEVREVVRYYYNLMETYFESTFVEGKIQPVVGIFMAKNHYGYKDQTENVIVPGTPLQDLQDPRTVAKKYLLDMGDYSDDGTE